MQSLAAPSTYISTKSKVTTSYNPSIGSFDFNTNNNHHNFNATLQRQYQYQQQRQRKNHRLYNNNSTITNEYCCRTISSIVRRCTTCSWKCLQLQQQQRMKHRSTYNTNFRNSEDKCHCCRHTNTTYKVSRSRRSSPCTAMIVVIFFIPLGIGFIRNGGTHFGDLLTTWNVPTHHHHRTSIAPTQSFRNNSDHISPEIVNTISFLTATQHVLEQESSNTRNVTSSLNTTSSPYPLTLKNNVSTDQPIWLSTYIDFHRKHITSTSNGNNKRRYNTNQVRLNFNNDGDEMVRILIYHCNGISCGGLGDRISGIVQAFYMAICTNRIFLIDWYSVERNNFTSSLHEYVQPHNIRWDADTTNIHQISNNEMVIIRAIDDRHHEFLMDPSNSKYDNMNILLENNIWMGHDFVNGTCWQDYMHQFKEHTDVTLNWTHQQLFQIAFNTLFQWSPQVQETVMQLQERANLISSHQVVAMHIRTGILDAKLKPNVQNERHGNSTEWKQFLQCATKLRDGILKICGSNQSSFVDLYLATDHRPVKEYLVHMDASIKTVLDVDIHHVDNLNDKSYDGEITAWSELALLQQSMCIVKSYSKYSETAEAISLQLGCAVYFDNCSDDVVQAAIDAIRDRVDTSNGISTYC